MTDEMYGPYKVHRLADAFPLLEGEEFDALVADIKQNGLWQPIVVSHDETTLIDGRNRFRACVAAGVPCTYRALGPEYGDIEIINFIVSANLTRRHLTVGQRAMFGVQIADARAALVKAAETDRKRRQSEPTTFADLQKSPKHAHVQAAQVVGVSPRAIEQAKAIERDAPDLADRVRSGDLALDAADRQRKRRREAAAASEDEARARGRRREMSPDEVNYRRWEDALGLVTDLMNVRLLNALNATERAVCQLVEAGTPMPETWSDAMVDTVNRLEAIANSLWALARQVAVGHREQAAGRADRSEPTWPHVESPLRTNEPAPVEPQPEDASTESVSRPDERKPEPGNPISPETREYVGG